MTVKAKEEKEVSGGFRGEFIKDQTFQGKREKLNQKSKIFRGYSRKRTSFWIKGRLEKEGGFCQGELWKKKKVRSRRLIPAAPRSGLQRKTPAWGKGGGLRKKKTPDRGGMKQL